MDSKKDKNESVEIDPDKVYITEGEQTDGLFSGIFGGLFDVFASDDEDDFPVDVFDKDFIEVNDVEIVESGEETEPKETTFDKRKKKFKK